jgi:hypothetical protein
VADIGCRRRRPIDAVVEPADAVEARVDAGDVVAAGHQIRREDRADVALAAGDQYAHGSPVDVRSGADQPAPSAT